jgi:hypothetical protein
MNWAEFIKRIDVASLPDAYFVFGVHKSGSTMMHKMVQDVCAGSSIPCLDFPSVCFEEGIQAREWRSDTTLLPIFQHRKLFFGFRFFPEILANPVIKIREKKFVLLVRDPRDALVSQYFSFGGKYLSHKLPGKNAESFVARHQKSADLDIDDYVIQMAPAHLKKMIRYHDGLDFHNGLIRHYEDVYPNKLAFLEEIFEFFGLPVNEELLAGVAEKHDVRPDREDPTKHIRKGEPGDHVEKLRGETVQLLNELFADAAAIYGYDLK